MQFFNRTLLPAAAFPIWSLLTFTSRQTIASFRWLTYPTTTGHSRSSSCSRSHVSPYKSFNSKLDLESVTVWTSIIDPCLNYKLCVWETRSVPVLRQKSKGNTYSVGPNKQSSGPRIAFHIGPNFVFSLVFCLRTRTQLVPENVVLIFMRVRKLRKATISFVMSLYQWHPVVMIYVQ
jgi:hypothetical protein